MAQNIEMAASQLINSLNADLQQAQASVFKAKSELMHSQLRNEDLQVLLAQAVSDFAHFKEASSAEKLRTFNPNSFFQQKTHQWRNEGKKNLSGFFPAKSNAMESKEEVRPQGPTNS